MVSVNSALELRLYRVVFDGHGLVTVHDLHRALWRAFPDQPEGTASPFLYRADRVADRSGAIVALVQTTLEPEWSKLPLVAPAESVTQQYTLAPGQRFRFYLRANPTVTRKDRNEPRLRELTGEAFRAVPGRRVAILGEAERIQWLHRKAEAHGFAIATNDARMGDSTTSLPLLRTSNPHTHLWGRKGDARVRHDGLDFEGILEVRDTDRFHDAVTNGIGRAKAFGYGLLSLRPE